MFRILLFCIMGLLFGCSQMNDMTKAIRGIRPYDSSMLQGEWFAVKQTRVVYAGHDQQSGTVTWKKENSFRAQNSSEFLLFQADTLLHRKGFAPHRKPLKSSPLKTFRYSSLEQHKKGVFAKRMLASGEQKYVQLASALYLKGDTLIMETLSHQSKKREPNPQFQLDRTCFLRCSPKEKN